MSVVGKTIAIVLQCSAPAGSRLVQPLAQAGLISGSALLSNDFADSNFVQKVTFVKNEALLATEDQLSDLLQQLPTSVGASYTWNVR